MTHLLRHMVTDFVRALDFGQGRTSKSLTTLLRFHMANPNHPCCRTHVQAGDPVKLRPMLRLDEHNNAVWLRLPRACSALHLADELGLWHPKDRMGKVQKLLES